MALRESLPSYHRTSFIIAANFGRKATSFPSSMKTTIRYLAAECVHTHLCQIGVMTDLETVTPSQDGAVDFKTIAVSVF